MAVISLDAKKVVEWLDNLDKKRVLLVRMKAQQGANIFQNYARKNRRWTDRTGHARQRLHGYIEDYYNGNIVRIYISHGVDYGIWLELANEKRYAILEETINAKSSDVMNLFSGMLKEV